MKKTTLNATAFCLLACCSLLGLSKSALAQDFPDGFANLIEHVTSYRHLQHGVSASNAGNSRLAHSQFIRAASEANKIAQFKLGLMYLEGYRGPSDAERAWAWMELSAERAYPQFKDVADRLWYTLDDTERALARQILQDELLPEYGDAVAIPKVAARMRRAFRQQTGSRAGFGGGSLKVYDASSLSNMTPPGPGSSFMDMAASRDGSDFYQVNKWDFEHIVMIETSIFRSVGTATIRDDVD